MNIEHITACFGVTQGLEAIKYWFSTCWLWPLWGLNDQGVIHIRLPPFQIITLWFITVAKPFLCYCSYEAATQIFSCLGVTKTWGTVLKDYDIRKIENHTYKVTVTHSHMFFDYKIHVSDCFETPVIQDILCSSKERKQPGFPLTQSTCIHPDSTMSQGYLLKRRMESVITTIAYCWVHFSRVLRWGGPPWRFLDLY